MMTQTHEYRIAVMDFERNVRRATVLFIAFMAATGAGMLAWSLRESSAATAAPTVSDSEVMKSFGPIVSHLGQVRGQVVDYPSLVDGSDQRWIVLLETASGTPLANASVDVRVSMPETGAIGALTGARYLGDGRYEVSELRFTKPGWWNVALTVAYAGDGDSLAFNLIVPNSVR